MKKLCSRALVEHFYSFFHPHAHQGIERQRSWRHTHAGLYSLPARFFFQSLAACQRMHRATSTLFNLELYCIFESSQVDEIKTALGLWSGAKERPGRAELVNSALAIVMPSGLGGEAAGNCCYEFTHHRHGCKCNSRNFKAGCTGRTHMVLE